MGGGGEAQLQGVRVGSICGGEEKPNHAFGLNLQLWLIGCDEREISMKNVMLYDLYERE